MIDTGQPSYISDWGRAGKFKKSNRRSVFCFRRIKSKQFKNRPAAEKIAFALRHDNVKSHKHEIISKIYSFFFSL